MQVYQQSMVDPMDSNPQGLHLPLMDFPVSLDYDQNEGKVFWLDQAQGVIKSSGMDGSDPKVLRHIDQGMID
jgi:hypothetical protein